jgi:hypothetical protein
MRNTSSKAPGVAFAVRRLARRAAGVVAECNSAQRRLTQLRLSPDRYAPDSQHAPDSYREFLFRTSGMLRHEPSARARAAGRACCW